MSRPVVYMIAGPNGAGKTTLALKTLPDFFSIYEFVNADEIARGLNPLKPEGQAMAAGRLMLQRMDDLIAARSSFAFETTGASHVFADKLRQAKAAGYRVGMFYVWLPDPEMAKIRVKLRVSQGGHSVPEATIERRYRRGIANLVNLYLLLADEAHIYNGLKPSDLQERLIASKEDADLSIGQPEIWYKIIAIAAEEKADANR